MFDHDITEASFAPEKFRDPAILAFMARITVIEDPALTARIGAAVPTRVAATLTTGERISREVDHAPGFAQRPMTRAEVERKFRGNQGSAWSDAKDHDLLDTLWSLDRLDDISALMGKLAART